MPYLVYRGICNIFTNTNSIILFITFLIILIYYIFNPIDIIPDTLGLIGYLDDFSFIVGFLIWIMERYMNGFRSQNEADYDSIISR